MTAARLASPFDRIEKHRDSIAALGVPAIEAISDWLADPALSRFALRVIGRAGKLGEPDAAIAALIRGREIVPASIQPEIDDELRALGTSLPSFGRRRDRRGRKPIRTTSPRYLLALGLSWPGFQPSEFGDVRRDNLAAP